MTDQVLHAMLDYLGNDIHRISHALKVYGFAKAIASGENLSKEDYVLVECAALIHDIGIPESIKKYQSSEGKYQEEQGMIVGREILEALHCPVELMEKILFIIGNHHSYGAEGGIPLQIIFEADFIVNLDEGNLGDAKPEDIKRKFFKTSAGKKLIGSIYGV